MRTAADKVDVASDRRRRENVPRHILCSDLRANHKKSPGESTLWRQRIVLLTQSATGWKSRTRDFMLIVLLIIRLTRRQTA